MTILICLCIGASKPNAPALSGSRQQDGEDAAVQRASNTFLQQVQDSRRRYAFEVEELKVCKLISRAIWRTMTIHPSRGHNQIRMCNIQPAAMSTPSA